MRGIGFCGRCPSDPLRRCCAVAIEERFLTSRNSFGMTWTLFERRNGRPRKAVPTNPAHAAALQLLELEMIVAVPGRHVGDDNVVAGLQTLGDLHAVVGGAAENDVNAAGLLAVVGHFKEG
jgi:hypothetical protein